MNWVDVLVGGLIGAAFTVAAGYWFYVLQTRRQSPNLAFRSFSWPLVARASDQDQRGEIEIRYRGAAIPRLTRSRVALWNPGWHVIEAHDLAETDPLGFRFRDGEVIEARVVETSRPAPNVSVEVKDGTCFVDFDFLDHDDGVIVDVLHTARDVAPSWQGAIKGIPEGIQDFGELIPPTQRGEDRDNKGVIIYDSWLPITVTTFTAVVFAVRLHGWTLVAVVTSIGVTALAAIGLTVRYRRRRNLPSSLTKAHSPTGVVRE